MHIVESSKQGILENMPPETRDQRPENCNNLPDGFNLAWLCGLLLSEGISVMHIARLSFFIHWNCDSGKV